MKHTPDQSWLHGKYHWFEYHNGKKVRRIEAEINTKIPYIAVAEIENPEGFYSQGEDADYFITQIHEIWLNRNCLPKTAIKRWAEMYLNGVIEY